MSKLILFFVGLSLFLVVDSTEEPLLFNSLEGAWEMQLPDEQAANMRRVMTIQAPYVFISTFNERTKEFFSSQGGMIEWSDSGLNYKVEFHTANTNEVGKAYSIETQIEGDRLTATIEIDGVSQSVDYKRIDAGDSDLAGSWRITDRMRNGTMQAMRLGSRKTIKMITGTRFQWVAFDPASKSFSGTGGGTVTFKNGQYTEHIEFFSRNADRVGASLSFEYQVDGDQWIHSGLSSSGSPIKEIWTRQ